MTRLIEFSGTPDAGKTTLINSLYNYLLSKGVNVIRLGEANGEELPPQNLRGSLAYNEWVGINACNGITKAIEREPEIILADRGFLDFRFWNYFYQVMGKATPQEVQELQRKPIFQKKELVPDLFIAVTVSITEAITRNPTLQKKTEWVVNHNDLFNSFYNSYKGRKQKIDTSDLTPEQAFNYALQMICSILPKELQTKIQDSSDLEYYL